MAGWGPFDLSGKNAVITGGALGLGFRLAPRSLEAGASVLVAELDDQAAQAAVRKLAGGPGKATAVRADVSDPRAGEEIVAACVRHFGSLDILVNNAGIFPIVPMLQTTPELFDRVYAVNLRGLAFCTQAAAKQMIAQGKGGKIVNIASIDSLRPSLVGLAAYDASKGGVLMFTRNLALELAPHGIQINAIAPGGVAADGGAAGGDGADVRGAHSAGADGCPRRHREGGGVPRVLGFGLHDGRDRRRRRREGAVGGECGG